jgi:hypothetical protein
LNDIGAGGELIHVETIKSVMTALHRPKSSGCFAGTVVWPKRNNVSHTPWSVVSKAVRRRSTIMGGVA